MSFGEELINIADHISFRKENDTIRNGLPLEFEKNLNTPNLPFGSIIRDIVSDADKLDAIGKNGFERLVKHATYRFTRQNGKNPTKEELRIDLNHHAEEKLLRLKDHFIRTETGKLLAINAHNDFVACLKSS